MTIDYAALLKEDRAIEYIKKPELSLAAIRVAIIGSGGQVSKIASRLRSTNGTIHKRLRENPSLQEAYLAEIERVSDLAESVVVRNIEIAAEVQEAENIVVDSTDAKWFLKNRRPEIYGDVVNLNSRMVVELADVELSDALKHFIGTANAIMDGAIRKRISGDAQEVQRLGDGNHNEGQEKQADKS
jgi:hypothetical protein